MAKLHTLKSRLGTIGSKVRVMQPDAWRAGIGSSAQRGYGYKWQKARQTYLLKHPLCVYCERQGRVTVATVVDHVVPHRGDQALFWDSSNWQALCTHHHSSDAQRKDNLLK